MTTEEQVEAIARAYCVNAGLDPDEPRGIFCYPRWHYRAALARAASTDAMRQAVHEVLGEWKG
jgi:hypothetical protein